MGGGGISTFPGNSLFDQLSVVTRTSSLFLAYVIKPHTILDYNNQFNTFNEQLSVYVPLVKKVFDNESGIVFQLLTRFTTATISEALIKVSNL